MRNYSSILTFEIFQNYTWKEFISYSGKQDTLGLDWDVRRKCWKDKGDNKRGTTAPQLQQDRNGNNKLCARK